MVFMPCWAPVVVWRLYMIWSAALTLEVLSSLTDTVPDLSPSRLCITEPSAPTVILLRSPAGVTVMPPCSTPASSPARETLPPGP